MSGGGARRAVDKLLAVLVVLSFGRGHSLHGNKFGSVVALYAKPSRKQVRSRQLSWIINGPSCEYARWSDSGYFLMGISDIAVIISFKEQCNLIYKITFEMLTVQI